MRSIVRTMQGTRCRRTDLGQPTSLRLTFSDLRPIAEPATQRAYSFKCGCKRPRLEPHVECVGGPWRIVGTSSSLSGLNAAALAGLVLCAVRRLRATWTVGTAAFCSTLGTRLYRVYRCRRWAHSAWPCRGAGCSDTR
jgi:hypothetical protein